MSATCDTSIFSCPTRYTPFVPYQRDYIATRLLSFSLSLAQIHLNRKAAGLFLLRTMAHNNRRQRKPEPPRPAPYQGSTPLPLVCPPGNDYPIELFGFLEPAETMKKHGYVMEPLTDAELREKARCKDCNQSMYKKSLDCFYITCSLWQYLLANSTIGIANLTKDLQGKMKQRLNHPTPPPPKKAWDPLPTLLVNVGNGRFETQQCTIPCKFHPGVVDRATKVRFIPTASPPYTTNNTSALHLLQHTRIRLPTVRNQLAAQDPDLRPRRTRPNLPVPFHATFLWPQPRLDPRRRRP